MKSILLAIVATAFFAACASKPKTDAAVADAKITVAEKTEAATKEVKTKTSKAKKAVKEAVADAKTSAAGEVNCKAGSDERKLAVVPKEKGCELQYTKAGQTSSIASQTIGNAKCDSVMTNIKEKLIASGYSCQ